MQFALILALLCGTGTHAGRVLLALFALRLGAEPLAVGILAATFSLFPGLLSLPVGKFVDRYGPRLPLVFGTVGGVCGMVVPYFFPVLPALYVAAALNGLSFAFYNVALQNLVGVLSDPDKRARNFSNFSLMVSTAMFLGPLIAGFSIDYAGHVVACVYIALISLLPVVVISVWGGALPKGGRITGPAGSIRAVLADPGVWRVLGASSLVHLGQDLFQFYMPIYTHSIGLSASAIGIVLSMFAAASFIVRFAAPRLVTRHSPETVLAYALCLGAVSFLLVPFFKSAIVLGLLAFVFGLGIGCGQPITMMLTFTSSAAGRSGEALGLRVTVNHLTRVVGPIMFGSIGSAFGLIAVFWVNALMLASGGALSLRGKSR